MRLCIPIIEDQGLDSMICAHFGSAPMFMVVNTVSGACSALVNSNVHHEHGRCEPLGILAGEAIDRFVVRGIGRNAFTRLQQAGIATLRTEGETVGEAVAAFEAGSLQAMSAIHACAGRHPRHQRSHG